MKICEKCGQIFLIDLDSCPICNQKKHNTEDAKNKLRSLIKLLKKNDLDPDFLKTLEEIKCLL